MKRPYVTPAVVPCSPYAAELARYRARIAAIIDAARTELIQTTGWQPGRSQASRRRRAAREHERWLGRRES